MPSAAKQMSPFHYWISFWPQAPFFGVEWRYARQFPALAWFDPADTLARMARAGVDEAVKASGEAAEAMVHASEEAAARMVEFAAPHPAAEPVATPEPEAEAQAEAEAEAEMAMVPPPVLYDIAPPNPDDLKKIKGIGPKLEDMLNAMGIYTFEQIAGFSPENLAWVDGNLTTFKGRPLRDDWVAQARAQL